MKVQIIYSSLTGCTRKVAEAIYEALEADEKSIHDLAAGVPLLDGDVILFGYWGNRAAPDEAMQALLQTVSDKAVGVFCTLGYYADSTHAYDTVQTGIRLLQDRNQVIGSFVCSGAVAQELIDNQRSGQGHRPATVQKELRWEQGKAHPTQAECALAAERFRERIAMYRRCKELGAEFTPVV